jgi:2-polyprenyl-3-methyl-5-hydroxy-6-metoxy-1,4-benzoquinol methylase
VFAQLRELRAQVSSCVAEPQLFPTEKRMDTVAWDKRYDEPPVPELQAIISPHASTVLSLGVGLGLVEHELVSEGADLVAVPLDRVVAAAARRRGIRTTSPDWETAFAEVHGLQFDVVLLVNVLQHVAAPGDLLRRLRPLLADDGRVVAMVPNLRRAVLRRLVRRPRATPVPSGNYAAEGLHWTDPRVIRSWLEDAGLQPIEQTVLTTGAARRLGSPLSAWLGTEVVAVAMPDV